MARYFSEHYAPQSTSSVAPATSVPNVRVKTDPGLYRVPMMASRCRVNFVEAATIVAADSICFMPIRSSDRIWSIRGSWGLDANETGGAPDSFSGTRLDMSLGLAPTSLNHDAAPWDANGFTSAEDLLALASNLDLMVNSPPVTGQRVFDSHRGLYAWELANLHLPNPGYTEDPMTDLDLVGTFLNVTSITAQGRIVIEVIYSTAGA